MDLLMNDLIRSPIANRHPFGGSHTLSQKLSAPAKEPMESRAYETISIKWHENGKPKKTNKKEIIIIRKFVGRDYLIKFPWIYRNDYMHRNWIAFNMDKWLSLLHLLEEQVHLILFFVIKWKTVSGTEFRPGSHSNDFIFSYNACSNWGRVRCITFKIDWLLSVYVHWSIKWGNDRLIYRCDFKIYIFFHSIGVRQFITEAILRIHIPMIWVFVTISRNFFAVWKLSPKLVRINLGQSNRNSAVVKKIFREQKRNKTVLSRNLFDPCRWQPHTHKTDDNDKMFSHLLWFRRDPKIKWKLSC